MSNDRPRSVGVVITRSHQGNQELAAKLKVAGLDPIPLDALKLIPPDDWSEVDRVLRRLDSFDWAVFTSPTGVRYFGERMRTMSLAIPGPGRPAFAAVGERTAGALSSLGVRADFVPSDYTTEKLGEELPAARGDRVLLLRADIADGRLAERFSERGFEVESAAIYRTLAGGGTNRRVREAKLVVFASASAVRGLCAMVPDEELRRLKTLTAVCIGPVTESAAREKGFRNTTVPKSYTLDAVVSEVARLGKADA